MYPGIQTEISITKYLKSNVILILNNHKDNVCSDIFTIPNDNRLVFDGWNQIDRSEVEKIPGLIYATMGYMTP